LKGRTRRIRLASLATAVTMLSVGSAMAFAKTITQSGSTSVAPLAALLDKKYVKVSNHHVSFRLLQGGSDVGVDDVAHQRVDIGNSSRDPKPTDPGGLTFHKIARDAICIITNKQNPVPNLTQDQVKAIFSRGVSDWGDVPGSHRGGHSIDVYVRTPASGTQDAFQKIFMGDTQVWSGASQKASNGLIQSAVQHDQDGVGYVSLFFAAGTNAAAYNGVACTLRNSKSGQYSGVRNFWMVTNNDNYSKTAKGYINWVRRSKAATKIIGTQWVPLH
jgi:phosphate transport system substrate-binding protein